MSSRVYRPGSLHELETSTSPMVWRSSEGFMDERSIASPKPAAAPATPTDAEAAAQNLRAAFEQGRLAGLAAGEAQAAKHLDPVLAVLRQTIADVGGLRPRLRQEAERDLVELAIAIARRVLHREIATDPEAILGLVKSAFDRLNARETHRLRVSPGTAAILGEYRERLGMPLSLEIVADAKLEAGGAVFETSRGELDASVGTQLAEIQRGLTDRLLRQK